MIVLGAVLRALRMGESLWYDEIAAWISYGVHGPAFIVTTFHDPSNHILHTLLSWISVTCTAGFLSAEMSLRLPAFLASLGAIPAVHALARRAAGLETAFLAALLMAVWPVCVLEGAEARGYSLMMLFSALATWQLLVAMETRSIWRWLLYAVWVALGAWAHMVTSFVAIGHGVCLAIMATRRDHRRAALAGLVALVVAAVITLGLYAPVLSQLLHQRSAFAATDTRQPGLLGAEGLHLLLQLGGSWLWYAALPGLALLVVGALVLTRRHEGLDRMPVVFAIAGLPMFVIAVAFAGTWVYARFALFAAPGAALLAAIGWNWLRMRVPWMGVITGLIVCAAAVTDLATRPPKQPLRDATDFMIDEGGKGSRVLVVSIAHSVLDAYIEGARTSFRLGENLESDLDDFRPRFVVVLYPDQVDASHYAALEARGYQQRARFDGWVDWGQGDVAVFERK